eukprot:UN08122
MIVYFWIALICHIVYSSENVTNETEITTTGSGFTTSAFFTTAGNQTFMPTISPVFTPTGSPSLKPTTSPLQSAPPGGKSYLITITLPIYGITIEFVWTNEAILIQLYKDAAGLGVGETVEIGDIITITRLTRRRLQETETGVSIEYLVAIDEPEILAAFEKKFNTGSFGNEFQEGLDDNFDGIEVDTENIAFVPTVGDSDD